MSNIQNGAARMPHVLSPLGFLAGQIGRLITISTTPFISDAYFELFAVVALCLSAQIGRINTISTTPVMAGEFVEMDAVGALRISPLRRGLDIDSTVDMFTFYVAHRNVYVFFSSRRRHTRFDCDWSSDVCSSD